MIIEKKNRKCFSLRLHKRAESGGGEHNVFQKKKNRDNIAQLHAV